MRHSGIHKFDRKNYFYPDLARVFRYRNTTGRFPMTGILTSRPQRAQALRIKRVHLEEDTGKLLHKEGSPYSLIDLTVQAGLAGNSFRAGY